MTHTGPVSKMPSPRLNDKRWSIDLEKRIQEEHFADEAAYSKDMDSTRIPAKRFS